MKNSLIKIHFLVTFIVLFTCDTENTGDCFQKAGNIITHEISLDSFDKIVVNRDIELQIQEGIEQKVIIETGKNLLNDISAVVTNNKLTLTNNNTCNYVRDYGITKVYITSPNITQIRSSTQHDISSKGVLTYPNLVILSEDYNAPNTFTNGDFKLQIDNNSFRLVFNNISNCFISGKTNTMNIVFASGTSRFEGRNLVAQNVTIWNRSSNDMIVNPQQSLTGRISGTGNVISVNNPPVVNIEQQYKGRLIYE